MTSSPSTTALPVTVAEPAGTVAARAGNDWYAFLPAVTPGPLPAALDEAAAVSFEDGSAIRSEVATLAEARAAFSAILPDGVDVTLYPVDD